MSTKIPKPGAAARRSPARRPPARRARPVRFESLVAELLRDLDEGGGRAFEDRLRSACARAAGHFRATRLEVVPLTARAARPLRRGARTVTLEIPLSERTGEAGPRHALVARRPGEPWTDPEIGRLQLIGALFAATLRQSAFELELRESQVWLYLAMESATFGTWDWDVASDRVRFIAPFNRSEGAPEIRETRGRTGSG